MSASILQHPTKHGPEQGFQFVPVHRFLKTESRSDRERLLQGVSLIPPRHDNNRRGFIPGGLAYQACQVETMEVGHFQVQKNPIESFLIHQDSCFLAIADRSHLRFQRPENLAMPCILPLLVIQFRQLSYVVRQGCLWRSTSVEPSRSHQRFRSRAFSSLDQPPQSASSLQL